MRIYRIVSTISVPDGVKTELIEKVLADAIEEKAGGTTVGRIITELTSDTLPTPGIPVEIVDTHKG